MNYSDFLKITHNKLDAFKKAKDIYAPKLSPDFNVFEFINPDEISLSKILAELLDPKGNHAQGNCFLNAFLSCLILDGYQTRSRNILVRTEESTKYIGNASRRIDILIDFGKEVIAIENKPWADDQEGQVKDYIKQLEISHPKKHCLVYLSGDGKDPSEGSIDYELKKKYIDEKKLHIFPYSILIKWLYECISISRSERIRSFLEDFSNYIRKQFLGVTDMNEYDQIYESVTESKESLKVALKIASSMYEIKINLLEKLHSQIDELTKEKKWTLDWSNVDYWKKYSYFRINFLNEKQRYYLCFGFDRTECQDFYYGISKEKEEYEQLYEVYQCLNEYVKQGNENSWNVWWTQFDDPYTFWANSHEPWIEILENNQLAEKIMKKAENVYQALYQNNLLEKLK